MNCFIHLNHSFIYLFTHQSTYSPHSFIHSLIHNIIHPFLSFMYPRMHQIHYLLIHLFTPFHYSNIHSLMNNITHPIHSFTHSPTYSTHSFTHHPPINNIHTFNPSHQSSTAPHNTILPLTAIQFSLFQFAIPLSFFKAIQ